MYNINVNGEQIKSAPVAERKCPEFQTDLYYAVFLGIHEVLLWPLHTPLSQVANELYQLFVLLLIHVPSTHSN